MHKNRKLWVFRCAAILLALTPFAVLEIGLRVSGWTPVSAVDPYVDLHNLRPLFTSDGNGGMEISAERMNLFQPARFTTAKSDQTFRVFALGGSTTQGEPYMPDTAFPKWLELDLQSADPAMTYEVINCGGLSYASYRVLAILKEVLEYEPDLIVVYTGHNEFLERRSYGALSRDSLQARWLRRLGDLRLVRLGQTLVGAAPRAVAKEKTQLEREVDALLDYQGGLEDYQRADDWHAGVVEHFAWNVDQMVGLCRKRGVPLGIVLPASNLADCPPMKFEPDPDLEPERLLEFSLHWSVAKSTADPVEAVNECRLALAIDPEHAGANFLLGRVLYEQQDYEAAREYLSLARDCDVCPLRATGPLTDELQSLVASLSVPAIDAQRLLGERSEGGILGSEWLLDHVHPNVAGHRLIARELAQLFIKQGYVPATNSDWEAEAERRAAEHLERLSPEYFVRGAQRLEGLLLWTQGRAKKIRPDPPSVVD